MFELKKSGDVVYYSVREFAQTGLVKHGFSTKKGGVSTGIFSTMNFRFHDDENPENVRENFRIFAKEIGVDYNKLVLSNQVHETTVQRVTQEDAGNGLLRRNRFDSADGLMTNVPGLALAVFYADCVPVLFLDPQNKAIAAVHSGWRGTVGRICEKAVCQMETAYGSRPEDILCAVGPSVGACCYEVSDDVAQRFLERFGKTAVEQHHDHCHVNLQESIRLTLEESGIRQENIIQAGVCTSCHSDFLFSHRKTCGRRGTMGAVIALK